jgi:hypothetical protein
MRGGTVASLAPPAALGFTVGFLAAAAQLAIAAFISAAY